MNFLQLLWNYVDKYYIQFSLPSMPVTESVFLICLIVIFYHREFSWKTLGMGALHYLCLFFLLVPVKVIWQYYNLNMTYVYLLFAVGYALLFAHKNLLNSLVCLCTFWTVYVFASPFAKAFGNIVCTYLLGVEYTEMAGYVSIAVISTVTMILFTVLMRVFSLEKYGKVGWRYALVPFVICITANLAKILVDSIKEDDLPFFGLNELDLSLFIFFVGILLYLLNCIGYFSCFHQTQASNDFSRINSEIEQLKKDSIALDDTKIVFKENMEEFSRIRHDIKNQIAYLQIMMTTKDYAKMEEYFNDLNQNISDALNVSDCENIIIRNVMNLEIYKAKQHGITIDAKIMVPSALSVSDFDMTIVLMNLLDNAIEACVEDQCIGAVIECNMRIRGNYLYINVVNPIANREKQARRKTLQTGKEEKELHGRGTKIVASVAEKYGGACNFSVENASFTADVMLGLA